MPAKVLLIVALAITIFGASASRGRVLEDSQVLNVPNYNMTKANYMGFTKDTAFDSDYKDFIMMMTKISYAITSRDGKSASGTLTFLFDATQVVQNDLGNQTSFEEEVDVSVEIVNNVVQSVTLPAHIGVDAAAIKKLTTAYANFVLPVPIAGELSLPEKKVNTEMLRDWNPGFSYQPKYTPDVTLRLYNFSSNLKDALGVKGTITFQMDAFSEFLGYTQRQHGESRSINNVSVTIEITDNKNTPNIKVDPLAIKPLVQADVVEMIKGYYFSQVIPAINKLFA